MKEGATKFQKQKYLLNKTSSGRATGKTAMLQYRTNEEDKQRNLIRQDNELNTNRWTRMKNMNSYKIVE